MTETSTTSDTTIPVVDFDAASAISKNALDAVTVVEAARMFGLPVPFAMHFNAYSVDGTVRSYDEIVTWAECFSVDVVKRADSTNVDRAHYTATGVIAGATVTLGAIDRADADQ